MLDDVMNCGMSHPTNAELIWNGFEWVSHQRYEEQRSRNPNMPDVLSKRQVRPEQIRAEKDHDLQVAVRNILGAIEGVEGSRREGLRDTPKRVAKAMQHWFGGYDADIGAILSTQFEDGAEEYDEMVIVKDIPFYSKCEHHMADIFGTATIAYIPNGKVVGLSKLSRAVDAFARRLQVQERLTRQIADALEEHLQPKGVGVVIRARHMCMESRGICQQGHHTITSAVRGVLRSESSARAEFMALAR